jgi:peptide-methionine (S)-S-oxide reductase
MKTKLILSLFAGLLLYGSNALADKAYFAGGCFWCMESDFEKLPGVGDVVSGYDGGTMKDPIYSGDHEGYYESVEVNYDPKKVNYQGLLDYYWLHIDPFDAKGQFCDKGHSYLSAIFVTNEKERALAEASRKKVAGEFPGQKVATQVLEETTFYPMKGNESYHQDYYKKNPLRYKYYRWNCGRDQRLKEIWGDRAPHH